MATILPIKEMSQAEKLRAMEELWADLASDELASPRWHNDVLRETEKLVAAGKAKFSDWETAKRRIREKTARKK